MFFWYQYKKVLVISLTVIVLGLLSFWSYNLWQQSIWEVQARYTNQPNLWGWAWTDTIGWISFNCLDTNSCDTLDYGVSLDVNTKRFTGYAWSDNVGWIQFDADDEDYYASYDSTNKEIKGWAKIVSLFDPTKSQAENDGLIKFDGNTWNTKIISDPTYVADGDLKGWAWSGGVHCQPGDANYPCDEVGLGWLSFNCKNNDFCASNGGYDYQVTGKPTQPRIISVLRTEGQETTSLTVVWNNDVLGEQSFDIEKKDADDSAFFKLKQTLQDSSQYVNNGLDMNTVHSYRIKACNLFGCNLSSAVNGQTSPIDTISDLNIDSTCYTNVADTSKVNLAWQEPSLAESVAIASYEIEYCVLQAGKTRADCQIDDWQPAVGGCSSVNNSTLSCSDVLMNSRYNERFNLHAYRVRAVGAEIVAVMLISARILIYANRQLVVGVIFEKLDHVLNQASLSIKKLDPNNI